MKTTTKSNGNGESLSICGRQKDMNQSKTRGNSRSKSRNHGDKWWKNVKCYNCQEIGHTKIFCPKKIRGTKIKKNQKAKWLWLKMAKKVQMY